MAGFENNVLLCAGVNFNPSLGKPHLNLMTLDGQLIIGSTALNAGGTHLNIGTLTAGTGITITNGAGSITIGVNGAVVGETITGNTGGAISPVAGNWNILGAATSPGTSPVSSAGSGNTLVVNIQRSQAVAAADITRVGLSNFDSTSFTVASTGFVQLSGGGFTWDDVSGAFSPLKNNGYFVTATATGTLPASPAQGDTVKFIVDHASQFLTIDAPGTQLIRIGTIISSAGGTAISTLQGDSVELVYRAATTTWEAVGGVIGTWTMA